MSAGQQYEFGPFRLDNAGRLLFRDGERMTLTPKAVELLAVLVEAGGQLMEKEELLQKIWADAVVEEGSLTYHISLLRRALGEGPGEHKFIETIPKRGYQSVGALKVSPEPAIAASSKIAQAVLPSENADHSSLTARRCGSTFPERC
jgi:DNA-binding winged helix-turn-helix (wHTH) protein